MTQSLKTAKFIYFTSVSPDVLAGLVESEEKQLPSECIQS